MTTRRKVILPYAAQLTVASARSFDFGALAPRDLTLRTSLARARSIGNNRLQD
jgi:hypothetical protein